MVNSWLRLASTTSYNESYSSNLVGCGLAFSKINPEGFIINCIVSEAFSINT